jgi:hypothetical protein
VLVDDEGVTVYMDVPGLGHGNLDTVEGKETIRKPVRSPGGRAGRYCAREGSVTVNIQY